VKPKTAITILENKTLLWSIPGSFNDPFEFKSPLEYGFELDEMVEVTFHRFAKILTQIEEPILTVQNNPRVAQVISKWRKVWKGRDPSEITVFARPYFKQLVQIHKEKSEPHYENLARNETDIPRAMSIGGSQPHFDVVSLCGWASRSCSGV
jgi:hypothetical protein